MKRFFILLLAIVAAISCAWHASAQQVGIKTNLLYDATASINLGVEYRAADRWTVDLSGNYNNWTFGENKKWKHWFVQPEGRFWFCEAFNGHFVAAHLIGGEFNVGNVRLDMSLFGTDYRELRDYRHEGWMAGVGIGYGYSFVLGRHWNLELEVGIGYIYTRYDKFDCASCGERLESNIPHNYFGPTKLAVGLVYVF